MRQAKEAKQPQELPNPFQTPNTPSVDAAYLSRVGTVVIPIDGDVAIDVHGPGWGGERKERDRIVVTSGDGWRAASHVLFYAEKYEINADDLWELLVNVVP